MAGETIANLYLMVTGMTARRSKKAPRLNGSRHVLFVHVPSGKIARIGNMPSSSIFLVRFRMLESVSSNCVLEPPRGTNTEPMYLVTAPIPGIYLMKSLATQDRSPSKTEIKARMSKQLECGAIVFETRPLSPKVDFSFLKLGPR